MPGPSGRYVRTYRGLLRGGSWDLSGNVGDKHDVAILQRNIFDLSGSDLAKIDLRNGSAAIIGQPKQIDR